MKKKKITPKSKLSSLIKNEKAVEILFESGMHCIGCPMAAQETLEQGLNAHGFNKKEIEKIIKRMNE